MYSPVPNMGPQDTSIPELLRALVNFVVQLLSHIQLFVTPRTAAHQASLSLTVSWSLPKFMSIESQSVMLNPTISSLPPSSPFAFSHSQHQGLVN